MYTDSFASDFSHIDLKNVKKKKVCVCVLWLRSPLTSWAPEPMPGKPSQYQIMHPSMSAVTSCWMHAKETNCLFS